MKKAVTDGNQRRRRLLDRSCDEARIYSVTKSGRHAEQNRDDEESKREGEGGATQAGVFCKGWHSSFFGDKEDKLQSSRTGAEATHYFDLAARRNAFQHKRTLPIFVIRPCTLYV